MQNANRRICTVTILVSYKLKAFYNSSTSLDKREMMIAFSMQQRNKHRELSIVLYCFLVRYVCFMWIVSKKKNTRYLIPQHKLNNMPTWIAKSKILFNVIKRVTAIYTFRFFNSWLIIVNNNKTGEKRENCGTSIYIAYK